jgi:ISXO2-like transposase domain
VSCRKFRKTNEPSRGKRGAVLIICERGGNSLRAVFKSESAAGNFIRARVSKGTVLNAHKSGVWNSLHEHFEMRRINQEEACSPKDACAYRAESFFSPYAPRRDRPSPLHLSSLFATLQPRVRLLATAFGATQLIIDKFCGSTKFQLPR